ncbi:MAG TPA: TIGR02186 family protein [Candidatus Cybelea sp.]|nr:TIGR02186 family protein [Candidatus Cybelea sp.]
MKRTILIALLLIVLAHPPARAKDIVADLVVHRVEITSGFSGAEMTLFGAIEGKGDVVTLVHGPYARTGELVGGTVEIRKKTRSFGIWVGGAHVRFSDVPGFYAVASTQPLEEITDPAVRERYQLGVDELKPEAVEANAPDISDYADALVRVRQRLGLYVTKVGHVSFVGERLFRTSFSFPSTVPTGIYRVEVYLVRDGKIVDAQSFPLLVNRAGFSADIYGFAHRHAASYGVFAVVTALFFGWMAHLAFRRR